MSTKIGEVIEAASNSFVAECYELHSPPPLGSLIKTSDGQIQIYAVVSGATTQGIEPGRRPVARGKGEVKEEDIYRQNPQLSMLLRTTFDALVVGYGEGDDVRQYLPPRPPRVHSFVHPCDKDEVRRFTTALDFLPMLLSLRTESGDETLAACLRQASLTHNDPRAFLIRAGKEIALLLNRDLNRMNIILRSIRP